MSIETADGETTSVRPRSATLAAIGYVPPLFLAPLLHDPGDGFATEHGRQSLVAFVVFTLGWLGIWLVDLLFVRLLGGVILLGFLFRVLAWLVHYVGGTALSLAYLGLMVAGIVQAARGRRWRAPFIGTVSRRAWNTTESLNLQEVTDESGNAEPGSGGAAAAAPEARAGRAGDKRE